MVTLVELAEQVENFSGELKPEESAVDVVLRQNLIGGDKAIRYRRALNVLLWDRKVARDEQERQRKIDARHDAACGWLDR